jgi:replicative DNA helicase
LQDILSKLSDEATEKYILKVMFNRQSMIVTIAQNLNADDFSIVPFKYCFKAIKRLSMSGEVSGESIMTLLGSENIDGYNALAAIGGANVLESHLRDNSMPNNPSVDEHINTLKMLSYRRNAIEMARKIEEAGLNNAVPDARTSFKSTVEFDTWIKEQTYHLAENIKVKDEVENIGAKVEATKQLIKEKEIQGIDISGILPASNRLIKRLRNKALYVFGAPEKVGKTDFLLNIGFHVACDLNIPVAYGDTEMTTEEVLLRLVARLSGIPEDLIIDDTLTDEDRATVDIAWERLEQIPFYHFNCNQLNSNELESKVKLLQLKHNIGLFIYDYVKIQNHETSAGRLDMIMAGKIDTLKENIAKQCNIPVITAGQMYELDDSKQGQNFGKNKHKFAETSHFTKLADVICRLDRVKPHDFEGVDASHYLELIEGRRVNVRDRGKKVYLHFDQDIHRIMEL